MGSLVTQTGTSPELWDILTSTVWKINQAYIFLGSETVKNMFIGFVFKFLTKEKKHISATSKYTKKCWRGILTSLGNKDMKENKKKRTSDFIYKFSE